ncbi:hypothetical protein [Halorarius halobius]|uniref:hypothetical protein n=1 Tax=Halorarius halobius TaxID=2962671 RepID=UPI0020CB770C|nr:hypothetical protein [Halorarius halobius]
MSTSESIGPHVTDALAPFERLADAVVGLVSFVTFWVGTLLPLTYVPLLATGALTTRPETFGALVAVNVAAMVLGHGHKRPA